MPNSFAYMMLLVWPFVVALLFRQLPLQKALIWSILGGYLLLPMKTVVDFPLIPALDKTLIPSLATFAMCLALTPRSAPGMTPRPGWLPEHPLARALTLVFMISPFMTSILNSAPTYAGGRFLPGLTLYDAAAFTSSHAVLLLPFLLGRRYLADPQAHRMLLTSFLIAGLAYSVPILIEVRLSPQLHTWVYGFFPHSFVQQIRFGGFRPVVFLQHGLHLAMFVAMALLAALALLRIEQGQRRQQILLVVGWITLMLVLCKTVGAIALAVAMAPLIYLAKPHMMKTALTGIAIIVLAFPILRGLDLVPTEALTDAAASISEDRAASLQFRFDNEYILLERANERPFFGWGGWGRNRVYDESGRDVSVTDGTWVIVIGTYGWVGYLAEFGLLTLGLVLLMGNARATPPPFVTAALAAVLAVNLLNLLPNSTLWPITWLMAGAVLGYSEIYYSRFQNTKHLIFQEN